MSALRLVKSQYPVVDLLPELASAITVIDGVATLDHPLMRVETYNGDLNHLYNAMYASRIDMLGRAQKACDWAQCIELHQGVYRLAAFDHFAVKMDDDKYWAELGALYRQKIPSAAHPDQWWLARLTSNRRNRHRLMQQKDMQFIAGLPRDNIPVYSTATKLGKPPIAWSLNEGAVRMSSASMRIRYSTDTVFRMGRIARNDILLADAANNMVLALPENVFLETEVTEEFPSE